MMSGTPKSISSATVTLKANVYFEGRVVSHTIRTGDGVRQTVGVIYPGTYAFNTDAAERMDIIAGACRVRQAGESKWTEYDAGSTFHVPSHSSFEIEVAEGIAEYLCSFEA